MPVMPADVPRAGGAALTRQPGDLGFDASLGQTAAQPLDQPGAEGVEFRDLRHVDEDVGPAAGQLFGVRHHPLEHRRMAGGPRTGGAQRQSVALRNPLQCRVAVHDANSCADSPLFMKWQAMKWQIMK